MCGIVGCVGSPKIVKPELIEAMANALSHRGPDETGQLHQPGAAFAHRRLSIIDLKAGQQPMQTEDGRYWLVFNGEIYNHRELRAELELKYEFKSNSDTEVLLRLYQDIGVNCVHKLRGMFAFAVYDRDLEQLFIARDHLGQKPLFYWDGPEGLAFASEIKSLLELEPALRELNPEALFEYLTIRIITPPRTMYKSISKLPPGHTLLYRQGKLEIAPFWELDYRDKIQGSLPEVVEQLDTQVRETIGYHLVSDVPVGAFLSGGVDSGLIVAIVSQLTGAGLDTFTGDVDYKHHSELPHAQSLSRRFQTNNHVLRFTPSLVESLPDILWHLDEPSDSLSVAMYYICGLAQEHVKVILGGDGGDELFGGYDRYYGNVYASYYAMLPSVVRQQLVRRLLKLFPDGNWYQSLSHQAKWIDHIASHQGGERYAKSLSYFYFSDSFKKSLYTPKFLAQVHAFDPEHSIKKYFDTAKADDVVDRMLNSDSRVRMPDHPVMILDRMSMAHGLEARAPLLDHKVAEFCARIPSNMKIRGRARRYIQLELAKKYLPESLIYRKKQGFSSPITYMLAQQFHHIYNTFLRTSRLVEEGYLNAPYVDQLLQEHLSGKRDHGQRLWLICSAEIWYRMNIDDQGRCGIGSLLRQAA